VTLESLTGVDLTGAALFDDVVTPGSPGTIDPGRRGQWLLGDDLDLVVHEWELTGTVILSRPDAALEDLTKVRLAVDLVRHPELPFLPAPEPADPLLVATALATVQRVCRLRGRAAGAPRKRRLHGGEATPPPEPWERTPAEGSGGTDRVQPHHPAFEQEAGRPCERRTTTDPARPPRSPSGRRRGFRAQPILLPARGGSVEPASETPRNGSLAPGLRA
jgi:hypothetical protein